MKKPLTFRDQRLFAFIGGMGRIMITTTKKFNRLILFDI